MPNYTTNPLDIKLYYTQEEIDSLISSQHFDKLIEYSPYLTIDLIKRRQINPNILSYDNYIYLATSAEDTIACTDINNIVSEVVSLNDDQKKDIKSKSDEQKLEIIQQTASKVLALSETNYQSTSTKGIDDLGEEISQAFLSQAFLELAILKPSKYYQHLQEKKLDEDKKRYAIEEFRPNAKAFVDSIAEKIAQGNINYQTNPELEKLAKIFTSFGNEEEVKSSDQTLLKIANRKCLIISKSLALAVIAKELWNNEACKEGLIEVYENKKTIDGFSEHIGSILEYKPKELNLDINSKRRAPNAPPRPSRVRRPAAQEVQGHQAHNGGHGL